MSTRRSADNLSRTVFSFIEDKYFRTFSTLGYESEGAKMLTDILATIVAVNISGLDEDIAKKKFQLSSISKRSQKPRISKNCSTNKKVCGKGLKVI